MYNLDTPTELAECNNTENVKHSIWVENTYSRDSLAAFSMSIEWKYSPRVWSWVYRGLIVHNRFQNVLVTHFEYETSDVYSYTGGRSLASYSRSTTELTWLTSKK